MRKTERGHESENSCEISNCKNVAKIKEKKRKKENHKIKHTHTHN
jgi:hypothetical protein